MSAAYHTAKCHGQPDCHCLPDHTEWVDVCDTPTPFELIAFWGIVAFATACTLAVVVGSAFYSAGKFST